MTGLERIRAAVSFEKADRPPVIAQVFGHAATVAGEMLGEYVRDGEKLAFCQIKALERYGYDAVFALMDVNVETEAMGSVLTYRTDQYPVVASYALSSTSDLESLRIPDPRRSARMAEILRAARLLRQAMGDDILVVGCVVGPLTLATQLLGAESALFLAIDEPERFALLLDFATRLIIRFGIAQIEAGAHLVLVFDPSASPAMVPPAFFREFEAPRLKGVFAAFHQAGSLANWLHIAGPTAPILPLYTDLGVDIANFDYCVPAADAERAVSRVCLNGNLKPLDFIDAEPENIINDANNLMDFFDERGGFILSSGCEIPPESKPENVAAMVSAAGLRS
jgi:uroporphyrinogen decarboxylase